MSRTLPTLPKLAKNSTCTCTCTCINSNVFSRFVSGSWQLAAGCRCRVPVHVHVLERRMQDNAGGGIEKTFPNFRPKGAEIEIVRTQNTEFLLISELGMLQ